MSFKVTDGGGPEEEERKRQKEEEEREWARGDFSWAIREVAANMLRIVRGAGKPHELLLQMKKAIDTAVKFEEVHGHWPHDVIANVLQIQSEDEKRYDDLREGRLTQADIDRWREDGNVGRMLAEHTILRGALQTIASDLVYQPTQKCAGERELDSGIRDWIRNREEQRRKEQEAAKISRADPKKQMRPTEKQPVVSPPTAPETPSVRHLRRAHQQAGFSEEDLRELQKAIKANDEKKIKELMSKISPRPQG